LEVRGFEVWALTQLGQAGLLCFSRWGVSKVVVVTCIDLSVDFATEAGIFSTGGSSGTFVMMPQFVEWQFCDVEGNREFVPLDRKNRLLGAV